MQWQLQTAKQRLSELVRQAETEGPQTVTRNGHDVVVVLAVDEFRRLTAGALDFKDFLRDAPDLGELVIDHATDPAPLVNFQAT